MAHRYSARKKRTQKRKQQRARVSSTSHATETPATNVQSADVIPKMNTNLSRDDVSGWRLAPLSYIDPSKVVRGRSDKVGLFFLMLSVIVNDIKDLAEFMISVQSAREKADELRKMELRGKHVMLHRFLAGALNELMVLILQERSVLSEKEFKTIVAHLDVSVIAFWNSITSIALANNKAEPDSAIKRLLIFVRNNASFHYSAMDSLATAWKSLTDRAQPKQEPAPYSMGVNLPETRFYYADAVLIQVMDNATQKFSTAPGGPGFDRQVLDITYKANIALASMVHAFLRYRTAVPATSANLESNHGKEENRG